MTAEACVMNKLGVALAADSAVTLTQPGGAKVYQSADKLFLLSTSEPVAAMFYGNSSLLGVPWETIIKRYRRLHGRESYGSVEAHAESFRTFLQRDRTLFPRHRQVREVGIVARSLYSEIRAELKKELEKLIADKGELTEREIRRTADKVIRQYARTLRSMKMDGGVPRTIAATIRRTYAKEIEDPIKAIFEQFPPF